MLKKFPEVETYSDGKTNHIVGILNNKDTEKYAEGGNTTPKKRKICCGNMAIPCLGSR